MKEPAGHMFAYFTGDGAGDEAVRLAVSRGGEPLVWETVAGGRPIVVSSVGQQGFRDPFPAARRPSRLLRAARDGPSGLAGSGLGAGGAPWQPQHRGLRIAGPPRVVGSPPTRRCPGRSRQCMGSEGVLDARGCRLVAHLGVGDVSGSTRGRPGSGAASTHPLRHDHGLPGGLDGADLPRPGALRHRPATTPRRAAGLPSRTQPSHRARGTGRSSPSPPPSSSASPLRELRPA